MQNIFFPYFVFPLMQGKYHHIFSCVFFFYLFWMQERFALSFLYIFISLCFLCSMVLRNILAFSNVLLTLWINYVCKMDGDFEFIN